MRFIKRCSKVISGKMFFYFFQGEKVNKGTVIPVSNEKDIFNCFGLDYLEPTDRDW